MGCNCKEKTPEGSKQPCADAVEESFRQAFLRESKKTSMLSATLTMRTKENEAIKAAFKKYCDQIDAYIAMLQKDALAITAWADDAMTLCPGELQEVEKSLGRQCPIDAISKPMPPIIAG